MFSICVCIVSVYQCPSICSFIHPSTWSFIHTYIYPLIEPDIHLSVHLSIHSSMCPPIHLSNHSFNLSITPHIHSYSHYCIHLYIHSSIHPPIIFTASTPAIYLLGYYNSSSKPEPLSSDNPVALHPSIHP